MSMVHSGQEAVIPTCAAVLMVALLAGCSPAGPPAPDRRIVCSDQITGEYLFSYRLSTVRDFEMGILGGESSATVTLDSGRTVVLTQSDLKYRYACRTDTTASSVGTKAEGRSAPTTPPVKTGEGGT